MIIGRVRNNPNIAFLEDVKKELNAIESKKTACINVKTRGQISPIVAATSDKRDKSSIE